MFSHFLANPLGSLMKVCYNKIFKALSLRTCTVCFTVILNCFKYSVKPKCQVKYCFIDFWIFFVLSVNVSIGRKNAALAWLLVLI